VLKGDTQHNNTGHYGVISVQLTCSIVWHFVHGHFIKILFIYGHFGCSGCVVSQFKCGCGYVWVSGGCYGIRDKAKSV
jgi:hypothetical protein